MDNTITDGFSELDEIGQRAIEYFKQHKNVNSLFITDINEPDDEKRLAKMLYIVGVVITETRAKTLLEVFGKIKEIKV